LRCFERFTDRARQVVVLAQEEARMLNHNYIGTEHLLLGLVHEGEGVAAHALESLGISLGAVRQQVEEIIGQGQQAPGGHIPFTPPRAKKRSWRRRAEGRSRPQLFGTGTASARPDPEAKGVPPKC
jgi:ATP-dependent Clp protease ATP-binding subunit ClpA